MISLLGQSLPKCALCQLDGYNIAISVLMVGVVVPMLFVMYIQLQYQVKQLTG